MVASNAANTSHILHLFDRTINKRFKLPLQTLRNEFLRQGHVDTTRVNFNLACSIFAFESISVANVTASFKAMRLYPFDNDFAKRF